MSALRRCESTITHVFEYQESKVLVLVNQGVRFYYVQYDDKQTMIGLQEFEPTPHVLETYSQCVQQQRSRT